MEVNTLVRTPRDPKIRINEILDVAEPLFSANGYRKTTISDIAQKMGVAQGMLYYYFKSKDEIFEALLNRQLPSFLAEIEKVSYSNTVFPSRKIELVIHTILQAVQYKGIDVLLNFLRDAKHLHIHEKLSRQAMLMLKPCLIKIIEEGTQTNCFHVTHPQTAVNFILSIMVCLTDALCKKFSKELLVYHLRMAETLIEKALGMAENTLHLSL